MLFIYNSSIDKHFSEIRPNINGTLFMIRANNFSKYNQSYNYVSRVFNFHNKTTAELFENLKIDKNNYTTFLLNKKIYFIIL